MKHASFFKLCMLLLLVSSLAMAQSKCGEAFSSLAHHLKLQWRLTRRWAHQRLDPKVFGEPIDDRNLPVDAVKLIYVPDGGTSHFYVQVGPDDLYQGNMTWLRKSKQAKFGSGDKANRLGRFEVELNLPEDEKKAFIAFLRSRNGIRRFTFLHRGAISCSSAACVALAKTTGLKFRFVPVSSPMWTMAYLRYLAARKNPYIKSISYVGNHPEKQNLLQYASLVDWVGPPGWALLVSAGLLVQSHAMDFAIHPVPTPATDWQRRGMWKRILEGQSAEEVGEWVKEQKEEYEQSIRETRAEIAEEEREQASSSSETP